MSNVQQVFERYEKKYMLNEVKREALLTELKKHMKKDAYGLHTISNIYYDTENYELIRSSIEKPLYKEKLRLRSYGSVKKDSKAFIEIKKKYKGIVYKRRIALPLPLAVNYLEQGVFERPKDQIMKEIDWFLKRYTVSPKVFLAYDRTAWFGKEDPNLRITFDQNIRFRNTILDLSKGNWGKPLLSPEQTLMEIKIPGSMPLWLAQTLNELSIFSTSYSKYGACYKEYLINEVDLKKGGIICA